jgi:hypothetical protein
LIVALCVQALARTISFALSILFLYRPEENSLSPLSSIAILQHFSGQKKGKKGKIPQQEREGE